MKLVPHDPEREPDEFWFMGRPGLELLILVGIAAVIALLIRFA